MKRVIAGATGFIGKALVKGWIAKGIGVLIIGRSRRRIEEIFGPKVTPITWDQINEDKFDPKDMECFVNLAGAGIADQRWTAKRKKEILDSRIEATQQAVRFCLTHRVPLFNASAVGIYGQQPLTKEGLPEPLDEDTKISSNPKDFLACVCGRWEQETQELGRRGIRVVNLRTGVVLGRDEGALKKMAMPFYFFVGGPIATGRQPLPWISLIDVCRAIDFLIDNKSIEGPVNLVAPYCVNQRDFAQALAKQIHRPCLIPTPGFVLKMILGQMAQELLLSGQHIKPKKLLESHFEFKHPTIPEALKEIYS